MAMPYKIFKTLEIDGQIMGMDTDVGKVLYKTTSKLLSTNEEKIHEQVVTDKGLYIVYIKGAFPGATTTGAYSTMVGFGDLNVARHISMETMAYTTGISVVLTGVYTLPANYTLQTFARATRILSGNSTISTSIIRLLSYTGG